MAFNKLKLIQVIDRIAWPTALLLSSVSRAVSRKTTNTPVIVRPGGMGDLICLQMAIEHQGLDPLAFHYIVEKRSAVWAEHRKLSFEVISFRLLFKVGKFNTVINSEQKYGISQIISNFIKSGHGSLTSFSTVRGARISDVLVAYNPTKIHETQYFTNLIAAALGLEINSDDISREKHSNRIVHSGQSVAIGGNHAPSRSLSALQWDEIIRKWASNNLIEIVAGPQERGVAEEVALMDPSTRRTSVLSFDEMCQKISVSERVLANDGGLVHIASYYGVPTDVLFTSGIVEKWQSVVLGSTSVFDEKQLCRPCTLFGSTPACPLDFACKNNLHHKLKPLST